MCACYLLSLPCDEVPNRLAEEGCQEGVKWGWLLQEGIESFQQGLLITQLIINFCHIACQQLTCDIWIPVLQGMTRTYMIVKNDTEKNQF